MSSDSANSHPPRSPVYTGPTTAVQFRGPQPGAGGHVHLPATPSPAQGSYHDPPLEKTHEKTQELLCCVCSNHCCLVSCSSLRFQMVTGLPSLRRAAAADLRATTPPHHCPHRPCPPHQAPLPHTTPPSHPTPKRLRWICTRVSA